MEFTYFGVGTTNIFPMSNSKAGGQLVTEYWLNSKDSVMASPNIEYHQGISYVHSANDFKVTAMESEIAYLPGESTSYTNTAIQISPGRAVVNGYYVESLVPLVFDLAQINSDIAASEDDPAPDPLVGELAIGLKTYFSDEQQVTGTILVETINELGQNVYAGVKVVILPKSQFITPTTIIGDTNYGAEENRQYVTADLLLATFVYNNGNISPDSIVPNPDVMACIPSERISNITAPLSSVYVSKQHLQPDKLYTFAGKGTDPATGYDTWCDSTDSLMIWDANAPKLTQVKPTGAAVFRRTGTNSDSGVELHLPHKQVDGMRSPLGSPVYFQPIDIPLPNADFSTGQAGIVTAEYTQHVRDIVNQINNLYHLPNGIQQGFIKELKNRDDLPPIYQTVASIWNPGDYILVAHDYTIDDELNDTIGLSAPSTMYVVLPPRVETVEYVEDRPTGVQLAVARKDSLDSGNENLNPENPMAYNWWGPLTDYRGRKDYDYMVLEYTTHDTDTPVTNTYYYKVASTLNDKIYSDPIQLTGQYPFATTEMTGGFLNVDTAETDAGYVYLDENGHLRLLDYGLLRTGVLAYQLGDDFTMPSGLDYAGIQANLNDYINDRVAFPNDAKIASALSDGTDAYTINININLPLAEEAETLVIQNIDSRFNTAVCINLSGEADSNTKIVINNCEKVRIKSTYTNGAGPEIYLQNSCLYYDATILGSLKAIKGLSLWYKQYSSDDLNLVVDKLTVRGVWEDSSALSVENIDYWSNENLNDNHIQVVLQDITFSDDGNIYGCTLMIRNESTTNIQINQKTIMVSEFSLISRSNLPFPENRLVRPIYVTGSFVSAYAISNPTGYMAIDTKFTIKTQSTQEIQIDDTTTATDVGQISVLMDVATVESSAASPSATWGDTVYHSFSGCVNSVS